MHPLLQQLQSVARQADTEFARGAALHGARIQCRSGCSDCCGQVFQITEPEAARISLHVKTMPESEQQELAARAAPYLHQRAGLFDGAETWESAMPVGARLPCPALGTQGQCRIYEARPIICRKFGVPVLNPRRGTVTACELNFKAGDPIEDGQLVARQTALFGSQQGLQAAWNGAGGGRSETPLCVGSALAKDMSVLLP